jgi:hypothetical protein
MDEEVSLQSGECQRFMLAVPVQWFDSTTLLCAGESIYGEKFADENFKLKVRMGLSFDV